MDHPEESHEDIEFNLDDHINPSIQPSSPAPQTAVVAEADTSFYQRVLNACLDEIQAIDRKIADINNQANELLESRKVLQANRQRLAMQRNAARMSLRYLEDSEAKR